MKVLVPFKSVPDMNAVDGGGIPAPDARWVINPFDEIALEEALRMKENGQAREVVAVTIGPARVEEQLRAALAMGADKGVRIAEEDRLDPLAVARILKAFALREAPGLIIMGKQAVDDDANQTGQMLAAMLGWPQATFLSKVEFIEGGTRARCVRETDAGLETIAVRLPAVLTTDLRLNQPRYVSLVGLMKVRNKPIETIDCRALDVDPAPHTTIVALGSVPRRPAGTRVGSVEELVARLRDEAKVL